MIEIIEIIFIAIIQGIGEFLPISSSGHIAVASHLCERFGKDLTGDSTDFIQLNIALHTGTLFAVLFVLRNRIIALCGKDMRLIPLMIVGTIPAVVIGLTIKKAAPWIMENLLLTSFCFVGTGLLLLTSLKFSQGKKTCSEMSYLDALLIGLIQSIAVLPGISRSGSTIVAGLYRKLRRDEAATFSFLLSIPVIAGGAVLELKDLLEAEPVAAADTVLSPMLLLIGLVVSFLVGIFALLWLLNWIEKGKLWYFAVWVFMMFPISLLLALTPLPDKQDISSKQELTAGNGDSVLRIGVTGAPLENTGHSVSTLRSRLPSDADENNEEPSSRINLSQEEARREYEKIIAEEEAKERALIEEERNRLPLVDQPELLVPLDKVNPIWLTPDGKSVVLLARVALREGLLELFGCRVGTKEHESVVSVRVEPYKIHAALLAVGAESGKPVQFEPEFVPPTGDEIDIMVRWQDEAGDRKEMRAQQWVLDISRSTKEEKKEMSTPWVFTGSMIYKDESGANHYVADGSGELFGLSNFVGAILDIPIRSSDDNSRLLFSCFTERIPETGTPLTLILTPIRNNTRNRPLGGRSPTL